jgi:hypothetical protein
VDRDSVEVTVSYSSRSGGGQGQLAEQASATLGFDG